MTASGRIATPVCGRYPGMNSRLRLLRHLQRVIDLNAEVTDGALQLGVPKEQLNRTQVLRPFVNERGLGAAQRVGTVFAWIKINACHPGLDDPRVLTRRQMRGSGQTAREQELPRREMLLGDPRFHRLSGRVRQLELNRLRRLLLHDRCPGDRLSTVCDILYFEPDQVTATKLIVDGQIEQGQVAGAFGKL